MRKSAIKWFLVVVCLLGSAAVTRGDEGGVVRRGSGGSIQTKLFASVFLNEGSSIVREWITITDPAVRAEIVGTVGVNTAYEPGKRYNSGSYTYKADFRALALEPIVAIEVRFLVFDVWGRHVRSLSLTEVKDFPKGSFALNGTWKLYSENECSEHYASIGYVARVRTKSGKVLTADPAPVVKEAKRLSSKFTEADLEPEATKK